MSDHDHVQKICADAVRANAKTRLTMKCRTCGESHTQILRWFQTVRFKCPACGGDFDDKPLLQLAKSIARKAQSAQQNGPIGASGTARRNVAEKRNASPPPATTNHQLVLQFRGDSLDGLDTTIALEDELTEQLGDTADVDGHDVGSGETNIFIFVSDPVVVFNRIKATLERKKCLQSVTAAYRPVGTEQFTVIWPKGSTKEFRVA